jgi:hypothetical protein
MGGGGVYLLKYRRDNGNSPFERYRPQINRAPARSGGTVRPEQLRQLLGNPGGMPGKVYLWDQVYVVVLRRLDDLLWPENSQFQDSCCENGSFNLPR